MRKKNWKLYIDDFLLNKLHFSQITSEESITGQLLHAYLQPVIKLPENNHLRRLIALHVRFRVSQIDLERLGKVLTHLSKLEKLDRRSTGSYDATLSQLPSFRSSASSTKVTFDEVIVGDVASIVCNTLYNSIETYLAAEEHGCLDRFSEWCEYYQAIVSLSVVPAVTIITT